MSRLPGSQQRINCQGRAYPPMSTSDARPPQSEIEPNATKKGRSLAGLRVLVKSPNEVNLDRELHLPVRECDSKFVAGVTVDEDGVLWYRCSLKLGELSESLTYVRTNLFGLTYLLVYVLVCQAAGSTHTGGAKRSTPHHNGPMTGRTASRLAGSGSHSEA